jgi:hypothetical protein
MSLEHDVTQIKEDLFKPAGPEELRNRMLDIKPYLELFKEYGPSTDLLKKYPNRWKFKVLDRVMTPNGPGTVVGIWTSLEFREYAVKIDNEEYEFLEQVPLYYQSSLKKLE